MKILREYSESLILAFILAFVVRIFIFTPFAISSAGMAPTLLPGDFVMAYRIPYGVQLFGWRLGGRAPAIGEVVAFACPADRRRSCIKRVVGRDGDRIEIKNGQVLHNDRPIMTAPELGDFGPLIVPPGHIFVLNDDVKIESDSRRFGPLDIADVEGRIVGIWMSFEWSQNEFWPAVRWPRVFSSVH